MLRKEQCWLCHSRILIAVSKQTGMKVTKGHWKRTLRSRSSAETNACLEVPPELSSGEAQIDSSGPNRENVVYMLAKPSKTAHFTITTRTIPTYSEHTVCYSCYVELSSLSFASGLTQDVEKIISWISHHAPLPSSKHHIRPSRSIDSPSPSTARVPLLLRLLLLRHRRQRHRSSFRRSFSICPFGRGSVLAGSVCFAFVGGVVVVVLLPVPGIGMGHGVDGFCF
jgi:hypothetical protein